MSTKDDGANDGGQNGTGRYAYVNEYGRILGRIEQKVDELKTSAAGRDIKLEELTERVRQNQHKSNNTAQDISARVEIVQKSSVRTEGKVDKVDSHVAKLDARVGALEGPVKRAVAVRLQRRKLWVKIVSVAASVGIATWAVAEPVWRAVAPAFVQRWFNIGGTP